MNVAAAVYTVASIAVLGLMIARPPVEISKPASPPEQAVSTQAPAQETAAPPAPATIDPGVMPPASASPSPAATTPSAAPAEMPPPASNIPPADVTPPTPESTEEKKNNVSAATPDYAREQRLDDEIRGVILDGEPVTLNDGSRDFMGILTTAAQPRGAVIILHGRGMHPDWEDVAHPLRTGLVPKGWTTLSLQMPVLEKGAKYYDYVPLFPEADKRIDAGIRFLREKGYGPIVLIAHSCGAHMAMHWVASRGDADIAAYVGLGMGATDSQQPMTQAFPLDKMHVPVLDVYGDKEYPQVLRMSPERLSMMQKAGNPLSKQVKLPDADHYFKGKGDALTSIVGEWLATLPL